MSARQAKNEASMGKMQPRKIDDLVNTEIEANNNTKNDVNIAVNNEINYTTNAEIEKNINANTDVEFNSEVDRIKALKEKMKKGRQKQSNKQVTVYLTPENYKRFNKLKAKGEKSDLINQLLDMYFEEE